MPSTEMIGLPTRSPAEAAGAPGTTSRTIAPPAPLVSGTVADDDVDIDRDGKPDSIIFATLGEGHVIDTDHMTVCVHKGGRPLMLETVR